jgi:hypothetical protein
LLFGVRFSLSRLQKPVNRNKAKDNEKAELENVAPGQELNRIGKAENIFVSGNSSALLSLSLAK